MDKTSFETYEYLPANDSESEQFFIVHDNKTFYVQNVKDNIETQTQPYTVYDVAPQQFLVDVDNPSELISVSDQYVAEAQNNLFTNSYLLQPGAATASEPMEQDTAEIIKNVVEPSKQESCTEITLSDEQYQMLERKGWLLLEIGDKMYVLNTLGLHDITTNDKLIEKLKNEGQQSNEIQNIDIGSCNLDSNASTDFKEFSHNISGQIEEPIKVIMDNNNMLTVDESVENGSENYIDANEILNEENTETESTPTTNKNCDGIQEEGTENTRVFVIENEDIRREGNTLKVKTKLSLKDFPDKIFLGKTKNGKRLVAKVIKQQTTEVVKPINSNDKPKDNTEACSIALSAPYSIIDDNNIVESEFHILLQYLFRNNTNKNKCTAADVVTADSVIAQLLQIPAFKPSVIDNNLLITKVVQNVDSSGKVLNKVLSAVVTGKVSEISGQWRFIHLPHMMQKMVNDIETSVEKYLKDGTTYKDDYSILHVQIFEIKEADKSDVRLSVTVNKRNIPVELVTTRHQHQPNKKYACSACAALFSSELELKDHQADHSLEAEDKLTIDVDQSCKTMNEYCVIESGKNKFYNCLQCNVSFNKLSLCKKHLKTHFKPVDQEDNGSGQEKTNSKAVYRCNMCSCTYFHPSTLSKHILSRHINKVALLPDKLFP
ncbi:uncharacterized protein LOC114357387 isoform X1 [Ostrinia furnacalis]|uniref:uncharacterized protein LOC114357387 isoform X1 n=1 Tax=Ostrinia furnacalis TaxID=93504 RepID=UPI00103B152A|nr:uncharacterized protein LOC114357387 isoform X1 [Ostrinia furnacalis]